MSCANCKKSLSIRPSENELEKYPKPCKECMGHDWLRLSDNSIACKKCRVLKREKGKNLPCVGKPPWYLKPIAN